MLKKILIGVVLLVIVLVVGAVLFLDSIVKAGIGTAGSHVLGVPTRAGLVSVGLVSGKTAIGNLEVDNPQGYAPVKFVTLGAIEVDAPLSQLTGEKIVIDRVELRDLTIELEKGADGKLNANAPVPRTADGHPDLSGVWEITRDPNAPPPPARGAKETDGTADAGREVLRRRPSGALPRPMISDTGRIVVRLGNLVNSPIVVYSQNLTLTQQAIAGATNFSVTGKSPSLYSASRYAFCRCSGTG